MSEADRDEGCFLSRLGDVCGSRRPTRVPSGASFALADSVSFLDAAAWDVATAGAGFFLTRAYLSAAEAARPAGLEPRYAVVYLDGRPAAAVVAQLLEVSAAELFGRGEARAAGQGPGLRTRALRRLSARILVCGNLLSWGPHGVSFAPGVDPADAWPAVAEALYRIRRADKLAGETDYVLVKDATPDRPPGIEALGRFRYQPHATEPDMVLDLAPGWRTYDDYLASLTAKYRKAMRKVAADVDKAGFEVETLADPEPVAGRLHDLYSSVQSRARVRPVTLAPGYLPAIARAAGDRFRCTVVRTGGDIAGFVTTIADGSTAVGYYLGYDAALAEEAPLYLRLLHSTVADAIALGTERLSLGRTALEPKSRLGARPVPLSIWIRHRNPIANWFLQNLLGCVPHEEAPDRSPFKEAAGEA